MACSLPDWAQLSGFYYNPKFLNFNVQPFYNRSQDNSSFQSVFSDSGVDASVNLFSGSHFPGLRLVWHGVADRQPVSDCRDNPDCLPTGNAELLR